MTKNILVIGAAGFIGSAVCRHLCANGNYRIANFDKLTYAGNLAAPRAIENSRNCRFFEADICDDTTMVGLLHEDEIDIVMHLAAESHVDRSIDGPAAFIETNIVGTFRLLNAALEYWRCLDGARRLAFRFHHISTDEVFGDLPFDSAIFTEERPYAPSSPYSASKVASDHLVRAGHETYGLPVVLSNCFNNCGPFHFPEKLITLVILNALDGQPLPVYGSGSNVRDWLFVEEHARALELVATSGVPGESHYVSGRSERTNLAVVQAICDALDRRRPLANGRSYRDQITFVTDWPGHDRRYAIDTSKIERELGCRPSVTFEEGLTRTIDWFLDFECWWGPIRRERYAGEAGRGAA